MIELYGLPTPNCWKLATALEELGLDDRDSRVDIAAGDQLAGAFAAIHPSRKGPLIIDHEPVDGGAPQRVFESDAIPLYLAELPELAPWYASLRARPAAKRADALNLEIFDGIPDEFRRPLLDE
ncbi:MAG: glutathione S-transferase N-terminal domain-containing protein [Deltaproteobacteria bacterium]|nr:glutathione S-transferase N-terminal domain-containing protein [Deltaproteobacteria bacterium]MBW2500154.1 glutathione S-transferase N-terminal domain-containing protein [Deltaproteobacteria bacterium]